MSLIYLDQNALISLGRKARQGDCREKLISFISLGGEPFVLSFWHLVETSYGSRPAKSAELADFIESLKPRWLLERHEILALDVSEDFYTFLRLGHEVSARVVTRREMFAALERHTGGPVFRGTLRRFVELWRKHRMEEPYVKSSGAAIRLRRANKSGKVTDEATMHAARKLIESVLPKFTPSGLEIPPDATRDYLNQVDPSAIASVALDIAISRYDWAEEGNSGLGRNAQIDKIHLLSALPYVDDVVSDDHFFHAVYDSVNRTGHVRARLLHNREFLERFE
jgi:hypothetical protein